MPMQSHIQFNLTRNTSQCVQGIRLKKLNLDFSLLRIFPLSFVPIFMIDAHSAESNEKSNFSFLFFDLQFTIYGWHTRIFKCVTNQQKKSYKSGQIYRKCAQWAETNEKTDFQIFVIFIFLIMFDFVLKIHWKID